MARVLIVEPVPSLREFLRLHLETAGHEVLLTEDTTSALQLAFDQQPDLIFSGTGKGGLDGLALLARLRGMPPTAAIPVVFISARADEETINRSTEAGAQGYLVLPVVREELLRVISTLVTERAAIPANVVPLRRVASITSTGFGLSTVSRIEPLVPRAELSSGSGMPPAESTAAARSEPVLQRNSTTLASQEARSGTVLVADIRNFSAFAERLSVQELADMLNAYCVRACEPVLQQRGWVVKLLGEQLLAMFEPQERLVGDAERALKASLLMCIVAQRFNGWLAARFPDKRLPEFAIGIGVHSGEVLLCRLNTGVAVDTTLLGDAINVASRLEEHTRSLGASVVTSMDTLAAAGTRFISGMRDSLPVRGRAAPVQTVEIVGLHPRTEADRRTLPTYELMKEAVARNTQALARIRDQVSQAPAQNSSAFAAQRSTDAQVSIPGLRILRKLAQSGLVRSFLAEQEDSGALRVLRLLELSTRDQENVRRFLRDNELTSAIRHPNVATVFEYGKSGAYAFVVAEYFPAGDLRRRLTRALPVTEALGALRQIAQGLSAVHPHGIVHRALKPESVKQRDDGTLVLADFGQIDEPPLAWSLTRRGEGLEMPYYLSPEQVQGTSVDARSDLYSLGVIFYEMLTGERPFTAEHAAALLSKHVSAPIPRLPGPLVRFQLVLDRLIAKSPDERFARAEDLLNVLGVFGA